MAKPQHPDHAGRMPGHPRYGNSSDPDEEFQRVKKSFENMDDWAKRNGGLAGGVSVQFGSGQKYVVGVGNPELAAKIVTRQIEPPKPPEVIEDILTDEGKAALERMNASYKSMKPSMNAGMYSGFPDDKPPKINLWTRIKRMFR